jgi:hypothetical protein
MVRHLWQADNQLEVPLNDGFAMSWPTRENVQNEREIRNILTARPRVF